MASPVADSYSVASGSQAWAGRYRGGALAGAVVLDSIVAAGSLAMQSSAVGGDVTASQLSIGGEAVGYYIPPWRSAMAANTWAIIPGTNKLSDLDPINDASITPAGADWVQAGLTPGGFSWCTMVSDPLTGDSYFPLGGGHHDYGGNDGYKVVYSGAAALWTRWRLPSGALPGPPCTANDGTESTGLYSDGRIRAQHTYGNFVWVPGIGPVLGRMTAFFYNPSFIVNRAYSFDPATGAETLRCDYSSLTGLGGGEGTLEYDSVRDCLWYLGSATSTLLQFTNLRSATWTATKRGALDNWIKVGGVIRRCPPLDVLVQYPGNNGSGEIAIRDLTTYAVTYPTVTGAFSTGFDISAVQQPGFGFTWCAALGKFLIWHNPASSLAEISTLTPPASVGGAWVKGVLAVSGANAVTPTAGKADGTFGRFEYLPTLKGVRLLNHPSQPTYFFATE